MTIIEIISRHLQHNRRLVVPALGCFIVKDAEEILFSELLSQDDGVLRSLLTAEGLSEMECAVQLDRFIFEVRHALETSGCCTFNGFGVLRVGEQGRYTFEKSTVAVPEEEKVLSEQELIPADSRPTEQEQSETEVEEQELGEVEESQPEVVPEPQSVTQQVTKPEPAEQEVAPHVEPIEQPAQEQPKPLTPRVATSPRRRPQTRGRRKGADTILILAVVVLVAALAAIGYGYYCSRFSADTDEQAMDALRYRVEESVTTDAPQN